MSNLVRNGIDFNDPRAVGLKCIFWDDNMVEHAYWKLEAAGDDIGTEFPFEAADGSIWMNVAVVDSDGRIPHVIEAGQPVPDGVKVQVWADDMVGAINLAKEFNWGFVATGAKITEYRVLGQSEHMPKLKRPKAPEIGVEYIRLKRDVEIQNKIFELLTTLYEQAKIEEAKDTPTIQILDRAVPPEKKYKPRRMILVVVWTSAALIFSIILAFIFNFIERVSHADNKDYEKAFKLRKLLFKKYNQ